MTTFAYPHLLWLLLLLVPMAAYYVWRTRQGGAALQVSSVAGVAGAPRTARYYLRHLPFVLRCAALALLVVALARPRSAEHNARSTSEGIDIVLAIDISTSMLAQDLRPDRITAAREVAGSFIADRHGDRIGLVAFAGEAFTQSPLTTDQGTLQTLLGRIRSGVIEDGTAIGNGLATAINRLRESDAKSKVIILLTDGENNSGQIAPLTAADIAKSQGIKVYTIGVGTRGMAPYPTTDYFGNPVTVQAKVQIDEGMLRKIAETTGGRYFRATDKAKLQAIYDEINTLEKSKVEITEYTTFREEYLAWASRSSCWSSSHAPSGLNPCRNVPIRKSPSSLAAAARSRHGGSLRCRGPQSPPPARPLRQSGDPAAAHARRFARACAVPVPALLHGCGARGARRGAAPVGFQAARTDQRGDRDDARCRCFQLDAGGGFRA